MIKKTNNFKKLIFVMMLVFTASCSQTITDNFGQNNNTTSVPPVTPPTTPPVVPPEPRANLSITNPLDNAQVSPGPLTVNGACDLNGGSVYISDANQEIFPSLVPCLDDGNGNGVFTTQVTVLKNDNGPIDILAQQTDASGQNLTDSVTVNVLVQASILSIDHPINNTTQNLEEIPLNKVTGDCDSSKGNVTLTGDFNMSGTQVPCLNNRYELIPASGTLLFTQINTDGTQNLVNVITASQNGMTDATTQTIVDRAGPMVTIDTPANGTTLNSVNTDIRGRCDYSLLHPGSDSVNQVTLSGDFKDANGNNPVTVQCYYDANGDHFYLLPNATLNNANGSNTITATQTNANSISTTVSSTVNVISLISGCFDRHGRVFDCSRQTPNCSRPSYLNASQGDAKTACQDFKNSCLARKGLYIDTIDGPQAYDNVIGVNELLVAEQKLRDSMSIVFPSQGNFKVETLTERGHNTNRGNLCQSYEDYTITLGNTISPRMKDNRLCPDYQEVNRARYSTDTLFSNISLAKSSYYLEMRFDTDRSYSSPRSGWRHDGVNSVSVEAMCFVPNSQ